MVIFIFSKYNHKKKPKPKQGKTQTIKFWEQNDFTQIPYYYGDHKFKEVTKILSL